MNRRDFIQGAGALLALGPASVLSRSASAIGPSSQIRLHLLRVGKESGSTLAALKVLGSELRYRTSIPLSESPLELGLSDPRMSTQAMAILAHRGSFTLSPAERGELGRWLSLGGFLWIDKGGKEAEQSAFDRSLRRELGALFPGNALKRLSPDHVLYRSFYRVDYPAGRSIVRPYAEALTLGPRVAVLVHHNDLLGALERHPDGSWAQTPKPGGESQREMAIRLGVNIAMYGLCQHYKDDQVHLDYLLHRRRWRIRPGANP